MAISKSIKNNGKWIARAYCFSGRPDPTWPVSKNLIKQLRKIWSSLEPSSDKIPASPPILGYRGCFVTNNINREWLVYDGGVALKINGISESRIDKQQIFEKLLLSSAPHGTLPAFCFEREKT